MNKKRLYKQNGTLHNRGKKLLAPLNTRIKALFNEYDRYSPRDLELLLFSVIHTRANLVTHDPQVHVTLDQPQVPSSAPEV